jgi:GAF domain-containing protein
MESAAWGATSNDEWTPADFLLSSRYCETPLIIEAVERLRAQVDARLVILLAHRDRMLFHSLLVLAHENPKRGKRWQEVLLAGARWRDQTKTALQQFSDGEIDSNELIRALRAQPPLERVAGLLRGDVRLLECSAHKSPAAVSFPKPASINLLVIKPQRLTHTHELSRELVRLHHMVNGSAAVVVNGNLEVERQAESEFDQIYDYLDVGIGNSPATDPAQIGLGDFAQALLPAALRLTGSQVGNVYVANRDGRTLHLIAQVRNRKPRGRIAIEDQRSVVSWVYRRRRPMVINDIPDYLRVHPEGGVINVAGGLSRLKRELAVPIIQHDIGGRASSVVGVVNVERLQGDEDNGGYSYRDVTVLRAVAHRLALWRASALVRQTSTALATLMKRRTGALDVESSRVPGIADDPRLPTDAFAARQIIAETLESVYNLTRSYTVTMRLLSPDRKWLIRFAAYPPKRIDDPHSAIPISERESVVAWVAMSGESCYLRNVRDRRERRQYRGLQGWLDVGIDARSELCLPIFVAGRLAGVLDLESRFRDGYTDSAAVAGAVAEQLGLSLEHARRFHEQAVLSMSTATTANVHELGKLVDKLRLLAGENDGELAFALSGIANSIIECSRSGASLPEVPPMTAIELVHRTLRDLAGEDEFTIRGAPPSAPVYEGTDALALRCAFTALLENAKDNADNRDPGCALSWRPGAVGGRSYATLLVMNNISLVPDEKQMRDLYRRPLRPEGSTRTRLGAFTAGALLRSMGGDVYILRHKPPRFIVGVDLPLPELSAANAEEAA